MNIKTEAILKEKLEQNPYQEILSLVCQVIEGEVFLVGGFVYRALISSMYEKDVTGSDMDFITLGKIKEHKLSLFENYSPHRKYAGFVISHKGIKIDLCEMKNQYHIKKHNLPPTLENYFNHVPLTIQAIAYDIKKQKIFEQKAFDAIDNKEIIINNPLIDATWLNTKAMEKAKELGFSFNSKD